MAQAVERILGKDEVGSSNLPSSSSFVQHPDGGAVFVFSGAAPGLQPAPFTGPDKKRKDPRQVPRLGSFMRFRVDTGVSGRYMPI